MEENEILLHSYVSAMGPRSHEMAAMLHLQREQQAESAANNKKLSEFLECITALAEGHDPDGAQECMPMSEERI